MNNSKRGFILVIILAVILVGVIIAGTIKDKHESKINNEEYSAYVEAASEESEESNKTDYEEVDSSKTEGLVEKLRAKQEIKILMLGDDMAMSIGRSSDSGIWSEGIKNLLQTTYGSKADLKLLAKEGATTETGVTLVKENDLSDYDLVILCYGNNDNKNSLKVQDVKTNYTEIITKIREKSPHALMIAVLESSLELNNSYRLAISEVATSNSLIIADMRNAFNSSGMKESSLAKNGFPNDQGYQVYTQAIGDKIKGAMG